MANSTNALKEKIQGWGADLDPKNRPAVPMEKTPPNGTGAHWKTPERQIPRVKILKSPEFPELTPVFGTSCPPKGLSGMIREFAYKFSEGRMAHWGLLLFADRVDVLEHSIGSILTGNVHNPLREMGMETELSRNGFRSRIGRDRTDVRRLRNEALLYLGVAVLVYRQLGKLGRNRRAA